MIDIRIPAWYDDALCSGEDPSLWFPDGRGAAEKNAAAAEAIAICKTCDVRTQCLTYALEADWITHGVWGATTENQRRALLGKAPKLSYLPMTPDDERHGTPSGYRAHRALDEEPCGPCREAKAAERKRERQRKREKEAS